MRMKKPNILFILTDQMRSTAMGCAGVEKVRTPNLDRLADEGTRFTNAIANTPSCAPSRASLLTGLHVLSHGVINNELQVKLGTCTLAGSLRDNGYKCGYIGKWHIDGGSREQFTPPGPRRLGFDDYWAVANCTHDYMHAFYYENDDPKPKWHSGYEPVAQTDLALDFIRRKTAEEDPFFLVLSLGTPHDPYQAMPPELLEQYDPSEIEFMPTNSRYVPDEIRRAKQQMLAGYYAHITALDDQVGRLLALLKETGLEEDTIVVFTSDHGDLLGNHDAWFKSQPWRESTGIPLLMKWPGHIPAGRVTPGPISIIEMMPTLLSLTGTDIPAQAEGDDLSAFVLGDEAEAPDSVFINFVSKVDLIPHPPFRGVVTATHTYAATTEGPWLLYDDQNDPFQRNNLITWSNRDNPAVAQLQQAMQQKLEGWLERTGDAFEDGGVLNDRYQPGHTGGILPLERDPFFPYADRQEDRLAVPFSK